MTWIYAMIRNVAHVKRERERERKGKITTRYAGYADVRSNIIKVMLVR